MFNTTPGHVVRPDGLVPLTDPMLQSRLTPVSHRAAMKHEQSLKEILDKIRLDYARRFGQGHLRDCGGSHEMRALPAFIAKAEKAENTGSTT